MISQEPLQFPMLKTCKSIASFVQFLEIISEKIEHHPGTVAKN